MPTFAVSASHPTYGVIDYIVTEETGDRACAKVEATHPGVKVLAYQDTDHRWPAPEASVAGDLMA